MDAWKKKKGNRKVKKRKEVCVKFFGDSNRGRGCYLILLWNVSPVLALNKVTETQSPSIGEKEWKPKKFVWRMHEILSLNLVTFFYENRDEEQ